VIWVLVGVESAFILWMMLLNWWLIDYVKKQNEAHVIERASLHDRVMALSNPEALQVHKAYEDPTPGTISYVGEESGTSITREMHHA
jgi:hypothetical protein